MVRDAQAIWTPSPNFGSGRSGHTPAWLILHGTAGGSSAQNVANWLCNPASQVSAHYIVGQDGTILQLVDEQDWAWANGVLSQGHDPWWDPAVNPNWVTISIEHVKADPNNSAALTPAQQAASFELIKRICQRWQIPQRYADANGGIIGHYSIDPVSRAHCPGLFDWDALWQYLEESEMAVDLSSPLMAQYFEDLGNGRWRCKANGVLLFGSNRQFYCACGGIALLGLPLSNEIYPPSCPGVALVPCERAILVYDPGRKLDNPPIAGDNYLLHIDQGLGQHIIADPLLTSLQQQISDLQARLAAQSPSPTDSTLLSSMRVTLHQIFLASQAYEAR